MLVDAQVLFDQECSRALWTRSTQVHARRRGEEELQCAKKHFFQYREQVDSLCAQSEYNQRVEVFESFTARACRVCSHISAPTETKLDSAPQVRRVPVEGCACASTCCAGHVNFYNAARRSKQEPHQAAALSHSRAGPSVHLGLRTQLRGRRSSDGRSWCAASAPARPPPPVDHLPLRLIVQ